MDSSKFSHSQNDSGDCDLEWHEANYRHLLTASPTNLQRLDALEALLREQYVEYYMTECSSLFFLEGQERKGIRMAKKQCTLFPGGSYEELAQRLLEDGTTCAGEVLQYLEEWRPACPSGERSTDALPSAVVTAVITPQSYYQNPPAAAMAPAVPPAPIKPPVTLPDPVARCFQGVVGMDQARKALTDLYTAIEYQKARANYELNTRRSCHTLLQGSPGSGKSLLAQRISALLFELGISNEAAPCVLDGRRLSEYIGTDGSNLEQALESCQGRTVILDDLSSLFEDANSSASKVAILCAVLESFREQMNFILTSSATDISHLLTLEPTLAGWFLHNISLEAYSPQAQVEIAQAIAKAQGYVLSDDAQAVLLQRMEDECRSPQFQGGKTLEAIIGRASLCLARRLSQTDAMSKGTLMRIEADDFEGAEEGASLEELLAQLDALTGLASVKAQIHRLTALTRTNKEARRIGAATAGVGTLHMIFAGNAGTGKTTVARIVGGIYRALGILPQGDKVVECVRADLVGQYLGHTAPKVKAKVNEALGGVLFIDEAYALCGDNDSFGKEAVDTLVSEIENHRTDLMVILAGYTADMDSFLSKNQGLSSRFPNRMEFADYTQQEMEQIFQGMLAGVGKHLAAGSEELLKAYIAANRSKRGFGNARGIRNLRDRLIEVQSLRLTEQMEAGAVLEAKNFATIMREDLDKLVDHSTTEKSLDYWLEGLNNLTGLQSVKEQVERKVRMVMVQQQRKAQNMDHGTATGTLHMVFRGNAGTGKTTVARIIAGIYNTLGLLPDGETFIECSRSDLVGQYQGQTAPKVKEVINRALGGVLFIDEAYSLCRDGNDTFGKEAVDALIADMENHRKELMVILAGYSDDMDTFFEQNQGMASRVPTSLTFDDYTGQELFQIFQNMMNKENYTLDDTAMKAACTLIDQKSKTHNFGNARGVRNIFERATEYQSARLGARLQQGEMLKPEDYLTILSEDFGALMDHSTTEKSLDHWLEELNNLTGLQSVKEQVERKVHMALVQQQMKAQNIGAAMDMGTLHMVFRGNAGTGKTTVARIIAGIYNTLGLLPDGDIFVECSRSDLVGQYQGQTAPKVKEVINRALGGVLFIDEAYSLCRDGNDTFGKEAVDALIADMENHRKELMVILAGYSDDMDTFFEQNQGMASRVPTSLTFDDYTGQELFQIFQNMMANKKYILDDTAAQAARALIDQKSKTHNFGNARGVRNIFEQIIERHSAHLGARLKQGETLEREDYFTIVPEDIEQIDGGK